jgi:hypothetical protein
MNDPRKVKRFAISDLALLQIFATGNEVHIRVLHGFPPDGQIVRHFYDRDLHSYFLVVHSDTFDVVKNGSTIPLDVIAVMNVPPLQLKPENEKETPIEEGAKEATNETQTNVRANA